VPVIRAAQSLTIGEIEARRRELTARARAGSLKAGDAADGTFTISNMGALDVHDVHAIFTPPQVAILGVGAPVARVVPTERGGTAVREFVSLRVTCDHRAINGATAARFLVDLGARLANPFSIGDR